MEINPNREVYAIRVLIPERIEIDIFKIMQRIGYIKNEKGLQRM